MKINNEIGMQHTNYPPFEINIKNKQKIIHKRKLKNKDTDDVLTIKLKLKNKNNPSFIKLVGLTNVSLSQLVSCSESITWHDLYSLDSQSYMKNAIDDPVLQFSDKNKSIFSQNQQAIGRISIESNFLENSS